MNSLRRLIYRTFLLSAFLLLTALGVLADPSGRVARLQYMSGSVSVQPQGQNEWVEGTLNRPLTNGDNIWADKDSRAELSVGTGMLRISSLSSLTLTQVSDNTVQVQLHQGILNLRVRHLYDGEIYEVDTPNLAFTVQKSGEYRFDVDPDRDTSVVTVWKGEGDVTGNGPAVRVRSHEQARFTGTELEHAIQSAPDFDAFDDWCRVRDQREDHSYSARYVAPGVIGSEDLDDYGVWREVPPYGPIWVPTVAPGWAPYSYGHWVWVEPWGWSWVDDAPWGFAPFHYGRWVYYSGYWGWAPGPIYVRPIWAPALVAWFGGPGWGFSFGFGFGGGIGWCPLGWGEPFFPWFGVSPFFFRNINITNTRIVNITNVTNNFFNGHFVPPTHFANLHAPGGLTAVPRDAVVNSRAVNGAAVRLPASQLNNLRAVSRVPVEPTRTSALGAHAGQPAAAPPARAVSTPVVSRLNSPNAGKAPTRNEPVAGLHNSDIPMRGETPRASGSSPSTSGHNVPRPPSREQSNGGTAKPHGAPEIHAQPNGTTTGDRQIGGRHYVPRPPESTMIAGNREPAGLTRPAMSASRSPSSAGTGRSIAGPRAPSRDESRSSGRMSPSSAPRRPNETYSRPSRSSVPRPTGPVQPARESRSMGGDGERGSSGGWYGRGGYHQSQAYSRPEYGASSGRWSEPSGGYSRGGYPSAGDYGRSHGAYYGGGPLGAPSGGGHYGGGYGGGGGHPSGGGGHSASSASSGSGHSSGGPHH